MNKCKACGRFFEGNVCPNCKTVAVTIGDKFVIQNEKQDVSITSAYDMCIKGTLEIEATLKNAGGRGTGFLVGNNGYAITNTHVVTVDNKPAETLTVKINGEKIGAKIIVLFDDCGGSGSGEDIALIKLDYLPSSAIPLGLGDSRSIRNGEEVIAIGNSLGDGLCVTRGIISDKLRVFCGKQRIMTDTALNPGNSGGPLINGDGKVIGVCVSIRINTNMGGIPADGMKYAIPINVVKDLIRNYNI